MSGRAGALLECSIRLDSIGIYAAGRFILEAGCHNDGFSARAELDLGGPVSFGKSKLRICYCGQLSIVANFESHDIRLTRRFGKRRRLVGYVDQVSSPRMVRLNGAEPPDGNGEPATGVSFPSSPLRSTATLSL